MKTKTIYILGLIAFVALLVVVPLHFISSGLGGIILTISTFLFGLIAGFYIVVTTTDYNSVKSILADETAGWIVLFQNMSIYDPRAAKRIAPLIDSYIRRAFDFEILDYAQGTMSEFAAVQKAVQRIPPREKRAAVYQEIRGNIENITDAHQHLTVLGTKTLSGFQWIILFALAALVIVSLFGLRTGEWFFDVVTVLIASSIVLILLLIRDLDLYIWNEQTFGYHIFENVLRAIGMLPYYPAESIRHCRIVPKEPKYRVGVYVDFPKSQRRRLEIRTNKKKEGATVFDFWK